MSTWPCALAPARRGSPIYSASPLRRAVFHTPVAPAGALNDIFPADSVFAQLQRARQPRYPRQSRSNGEASRSCSVRLMLRPARSACPALVRTFTSELSQAGSPPEPASDITSWLIVCYHGRIFPGRIGSLMGCDGDWTFAGGTLPQTLPRTCIESTLTRFQPMLGASTQLDLTSRRPLAAVPKQVQPCYRTGRGKQML